MPTAVTLRCPAFQAGRGRHHGDQRFVGQSCGLFNIGQLGRRLDHAQSADDVRGLLQRAPVLERAAHPLPVRTSQPVGVELDANTGSAQPLFLEDAT